MQRHSTVDNVSVHPQSFVPLDAELLRSSAAALSPRPVMEHEMLRHLYVPAADEAHDEARVAQHFLDLDARDTEVIDQAVDIRIRR